MAGLRVGMGRREKCFDVVEVVELSCRWEWGEEDVAMWRKMDEVYTSL